ncbi:MAG: hypothetical protein JXA30_16205 [Deltaproteobacteria bacterium]|nr:hypothetical protein [Deltaproteobacteria bacterium]
MWYSQSRKHVLMRRRSPDGCFGKSRFGWIALLLALGYFTSCSSSGPNEQSDSGDATSEEAGFDASTDEPIVDAGDDAWDSEMAEREEIKEDGGPETDVEPPPDSAEDHTGPSCPDEDGDGFSDIECGGDDCDDSDESVNPGVVEVCDNGRDDDCNPVTLDIDDRDRDGYNCLEDCDDDNPRRNPGRTEVCGNDLDDDCDESTLDRLDKDGDGFDCDVDCDDDDPEVNPDATEICGNALDDDCDPSTLDLGDRDGDGFRCDADCDDNDETVPEDGFYCGSKFLYFEDFESGDGGWSAGGDAPGWQWGKPRGRDIVGAASGQYAWVTDLTGFYGADQVMTLTSPLFDLSGLTADPVLLFNRIYDFGSGDQLWLELSLDGGDSWNHLAAGAFSRNFYNASQSFIDTSDAWLYAKTLMTGAAGSSSVRVRFLLLSDAEAHSDGFALDDVRIVDTLFDVSAVALDVPGSGCGDNRSAGTVTLTVRNDSSVPLSDFDVAYTLDKGARVVETISSPLAPGQQTDHTFSETVDLRSLGMHQITAEVLPGSERDSDLSDNGLTVFSYSFMNVGTGPYEQSFESDDGGWAATGENSSWAWGIPIGDVIGAAAEGRYAWVTNLWGASNRNEMSYLTSPCFDLSDYELTDPDPILAFEHNYEINGRGWCEISLDGGTSWNKLGTSVSGVNWYNDALSESWSGEANLEHHWQSAYHRLDGAAGREAVQLRFALESNGDTAGMGVDYVRILHVFADPQLSGFEIPQTICENHGPISVSVSVTNGGNRDLSNFELSYKLDDQPAVTQNVTETISPGVSKDYQFAAPMIVPTVGSHRLRFTVEADADVDLANSTLEAHFSVIRSVIALGYEEGFEVDDGGWWTVGERSSWQHGTPLGAAIDFITAAAGGSKAWITNRFGNYRNDETSYLVSPCIDFSAFAADPTIRFDHIFETEPSVDQGWLEVSFDGGQNWEKVGAFGTGSNWYNDEEGQCWSASSGLAAQWRLASHPLVGAAGLSDVLVRFVFSSNSELNAEGFGVDNISFIE